MENKQINVSSVYCILNIHNGRRYVGSTTKFSKRKVYHLSDLKCKRHHSKLLQDDYEMFGKDALKFFILEEVRTFELAELLSREQFWIDSYKPEYNINLVAGHVIPHTARTPEAKEKLRQRMIGRKQTQDEKDRRGESIKKYWATHPPKIMPQSAKDTLSKINKGKKNPNWGLKRTPEQLQRQSEGRANIIYTYKSPDGELISFRNLSKTQIGIPYWALRLLYRKLKDSYKGWTFVGSVKV